MTIQSPANPTVKAARKLARRRDRMRRGAFLVEGPEVVREALDALVEVFVSTEADPQAREVTEAAAAAGVPVRTVTPPVLATFADTVTPRGVVAVAALEPPEPAEVLAQADFAVLGCAVADPGNVGTIVRTADAAGADAVLLGAGSVDARNPKAVRASAGSLFHLPVVDGVDPVATVRAAQERGLTAIAADAGGAVAHTDANLAGPVLLVLGGEAHGVPAAVTAACDLTVRVPMAGGDRPGWTGAAESLNVAATAAVLCFEAARQRSLR